MKGKAKGFIPGFVTALLLVGLIGTAYAAVGQKQAALNYNNIGIKLNSLYIFPEDVNGKYIEPFSIDGTVYLPVRGIASILGLDVAWDSSTSTVELTGPKTSIGPFYDNTAIPRFDFIIGQRALVYQGNNINGKNIQGFTYLLSLSEKGDFSSLKKLYDDMLAKVGYKQSFSANTDNGPFYVYTNSNEKYDLSLQHVNKPGQDESVVIFVEYTGTSSATPSTPSAGGAITPDIPTETAPPSDKPMVSSLCPVCELDRSVSQSYSDGSFSLVCRNPQCRTYNRPVRVYP